MSDDDDGDDDDDGTTTTKRTTARSSSVCGICRIAILGLGDGLVRGLAAARYYIFGWANSGVQRC